MPPNQWGWCKTGSEQAFCHRNHVWSVLPATPNGGQNRECPVCRGNLAVNPANVPNQWIVITCHGSGCDRGVIRDKLINEAGIDARCLGLAGLEGVSRGRTSAPLPAESPSARAAIRRSYVHAKLAYATTDNATLLKLAIWLVARSDGNGPADFESILPDTQAGLAAALREFGIEKSHAFKLARNYFRSRVA